MANNFYQYIIYAIFSIIIIMMITHIFDLKKEIKSAYLGQEKILELNAKRDEVEKKTKEAREQVSDELESFNSIVDKLFSK